MIEANTSQTEANMSDLMSIIPVVTIIALGATIASLLMKVFNSKEKSNIEVKVKKKGMITYE
jgi:hypothetical protein